jgi:hypothetical protein
VVSPVTASPDQEPPRPRTCAQSGIYKPKQYTDGTIKYGLAATTEPTSVDTALADENRKKAMDVEYDALMKNKTWHLVPPSYGHNIIDCRRVYKVKGKLMVLLTNTRLVLLLKDTSNTMVLIMKTPSVL